MYTSVHDAFARRIVGSLLDEVPGIEPFEEFLETVEETDGHTEIVGARKHFRFTIDSLVASHPKRISTTAPSSRKRRFLVSCSQR